MKRELKVGIGETEVTVAIVDRKAHPDEKGTESYPKDVRYVVRVDESQGPSR